MFTCAVLSATAPHRCAVLTPCVGDHVAVVSQTERCRRQQLSHARHDRVRYQAPSNALIASVM